MIPMRKRAEQIASVGITSNRVEQARAIPAKIQSANNTRTEAGINRQSTPFANCCGLTSLSKKLFTTKAIVTIRMTLRAASDTNGRRKKKLLNPPIRYAITSPSANTPTAKRSVEP